MPKMKNTKAAVSTPVPAKASEKVTPKETQTGPTIKGWEFKTAAGVSANDLKIGQKYLVVKDVSGEPDSHFPEVDRNKATDVVLTMTFLGWDDTAIPIGNGDAVIPLSSDDPDEVNKVRQASSSGVTSVAKFDDGRTKFADPVWTVVVPQDVPLFVFSEKKRGDAERVASFFSARAFTDGWTHVIAEAKLMALIASPDLKAVTEWLDSQPLTVLRKAASVYGAKVRDIFKEGVDREGAAKAVIQIRKSLTKAGLEKLQTIRVEAEKSHKELKENFAKCEVSHIFDKEIEGKSLIEALTTVEHANRVAVVKKASEKKAKTAEVATPDIQKMKEVAKKADAATAAKAIETKKHLAKAEADAKKVSVKVKAKK